MAKAIEKWNEIQSDERFKSFSPEQQLATRNQFFDRYIAPKIDDDVREVARKQFYQLSGVQDVGANVSVAPQPQQQTQPLSQLQRRESRVKDYEGGTGTIGGALKKAYGGMVNLLDQAGVSNFIDTYDDEGNKTIAGGFRHGVSENMVSGFKRQAKGLGAFAVDKVRDNQVGSEAYDYLIAVKENPQGQKAQELREMGVNIDKLLNIDMTPSGRNRKPSMMEIRQTDGWRDLVSALEDRDTTLNRTVSNLRQSAAYDKSNMDFINSTVDPWSAAGIVQNAGTAIGNMLPALAVSAVATPAAGAALMGTQVFGDTYVDGLESGLAEDQAVGRAVLFSAAEGLSEKIPLGILTREGGTLLKRILKSSGAEGIQESITEAIQIGIDNQILNESMTWRETVNNLAYAGLLGTIAGGTLSVPGHYASIEKERFKKWQDAKKAELEKALKERDQTIDELFDENYGKAGLDLAEEMAQDETNTRLPNFYGFEEGRPDPRHDRGAGPLAREYANELAESGSMPGYPQLPLDDNLLAGDGELFVGKDARQIADDMRTGEIGEGVPVIDLERPVIVPPKDPSDPNLKQYATYVESDLVKHYSKGGKHIIPGVIKRDINEAVAKAIDPYAFRKDGGWFINQRKLKKRNPTPLEEAQAIFDKLPRDFKGNAQLIEQLIARSNQLNSLPDLDQKTRGLLQTINKRLGNNIKLESQQAGTQTTLEQGKPKATPKNIKPIEQLVGARPRYNYGKKSFALGFERELDKFAFILAQDKKSKEDKSYLYHAMEQTGLSESEVRAYGKQLKDYIKSQAKDAAPGKISIPSGWNKSGEKKTKPQPKTNSAGQKLADPKKFDNERWGEVDKQEREREENLLSKGIKPLEQVIDNIEKKKNFYEYKYAFFDLNFENIMDKFAYNIGETSKFENVMDQHFESGSAKTRDADFKSLAHHFSEQTGLVGSEISDYVEKIREYIESEAKQFKSEKINIPKNWENLWAKNRIALKKSNSISATEIDEKANESALSPKNDLPLPTQAQKEAGNYKKGKINIQGLDISIENPKGSKRSGTDSDGKNWSITMKSHYGYIRRTEGADGEHVDVFVGDKPESTQVYVIHQKNLDGSFDEHKVMIGYNSLAAAKRGYLQNYSKGWKGLGNVESMSMDQFKQWLSTSAPMRSTENAQIEKEPRQEATQKTSTKAEAEITTTVTDEKPTAEQSSAVQDNDRDQEDSSAVSDEDKAKETFENISLDAVFSITGVETLNYDHRELIKLLENDGWEKSTKKKDQWIKGDFQISIGWPDSSAKHANAKWMKIPDESIDDKPTRIYFPTVTISGAQYDPTSERLETYNGIMLKEGTKAKTSAGRETKEFPKTETVTPREKYLAIWNTKRWLFREALAEAEHRGESEQIEKFKALSREYRQTSNDDVSDAQDYLFDYDLYNRESKNDPPKAQEKPPELPVETPKDSQEDGQSTPLTGQKDVPEEIITHTTKKGKQIKGVVRKDLTKDQAKEIDPYTFKKDGGWFIREKHLDVKSETNPLPKSSVEPVSKPEIKDISLGTVGMKVAQGDNNDDFGLVADIQKTKDRIRTYKNKQVNGTLSRKLELQLSDLEKRLRKQRQSIFEAEKMLKEKGGLSDEMSELFPSQPKLDSKKDAPKEIKNKISFEDYKATIATALSMDNRGEISKNASFEIIENLKKEHPEYEARLQKELNSALSGESNQQPETINETFAKQIERNLSLQNPKGGNEDLLGSSRLKPDIGIKDVLIDMGWEDVGNGTLTKENLGTVTFSKPDGFVFGAVTLSYSPVPKTKKQTQDKVEKPKTKLQELDLKIDKAEQAAIDDLKALLKSRSGTMNSGVDPELMLGIARVGGFSIAKGAVKFAVWVERMIEVLRSNDVRDADVIPHLKEAYAAISANPTKYGLNDDQADEMDSPKVLRSTDVSKLIEDIDNAEQRRSGLRESSEGGTSGVQEGSTGQRRVQPDNTQSGMVNETVAGTQPSAVERPEANGDNQRDGRTSSSKAGGGKPKSDRAGNADTGRNANSKRKSSNARTGKPRRDRGVADGTSPSNRTHEVFHIDNPLEVVGGTQVQRFDKNKAAIELYKTLEEEDRAATPDEQKILAGWTGWGSFGQDLFQGSWDHPAPKKGWEERDAWLRDNVTKSEWESLQRSITNSHYTDPPTVMAMWDMVKKMGFKFGKVLEPAMGIGNFFSMMPKEMKQRSLLTGIELDQLTGGMAKKIFPEENIKIMGYQDSKTPDSFYDLIIGNWPFENTKIADRKYNKFNPSIHDYFFLKTIDQVRPGGIVIGITSSSTMDKKDNAIRREIAKKAELVASYRLPSGAFKEYAGTSVVTDIIILKKRPEKLANVEGEDWINSSEYEISASESFSLNDYYHKNPSHIVGKLGYGHGTTFNRKGMIVERPKDMQQAIDKIIDMTPENIYEKDQKTAHISYITNNIDDRLNALVEEKGELYVSQGEHLAVAQDVRKWKLKKADSTELRKNQLKKLIKIRKVYGELITAEVAGDYEKASDLRPELEKTYKSFKSESGGKWLQSFELKYLKGINDPFYPSLAALEVYDSKKKKYVPSDVFTKSTIRKPLSIENPSVEDAYVLTRNQSIIPSLDEIAKLAKTEPEKAKKELIESGAIFELPNGDIMPSDIYLSGDVRDKLFDAEVALEDGNKAMEHNVQALKKVIPKDIPYFNIEAQLGATWVPNEQYKEFIAHLLNRENTEGIEIRYQAGRWTVEIESGLLNIPEAITGFGTKFASFSRVMNWALRNQKPTIKRTDPNTGETYVVVEETNEINERIEKIRQDFKDWLWKDPERKVNLETQYNKIRNSYATPNYDGSFLRFPGMALKFGNSPLDLRRHQVDAIWRALVTKKSLNAHEVGTGKTFTMGGIAIESRRYGIAKKPLILAHNANSASVAEEIQQMYPAAKVLYIESMAKEKTAIAMMQIANEDWDAVVLPHSLIDRMTLSEETLMSIAQEEIDALESEARAAAQNDGVSLEGIDLSNEEAVKKIRSHTAKDLVKQRNKIIENIKKQSQKASKEGAITFENLGIDMILVDEAHEFKKPPISTQMQMKGLNTDVSNKSIALSFLTKYIRQMNAGGNVHLFTGTPITNTMTEAFHMMKYIMHEEMAEEGIDHWDGWFGSFAQEVDDVELNAAGEYEPVNRLASFINVPELRQMLGQYMDVVFADDMPEMQPRKLKSGKTAKDELTPDEQDELLNGRTEGAKDRPYKKIINVNAEMTQQQLKYFELIKSYAKDFRDAPAKEKRRIMQSGDVRSPIIYEGLANKVSVDARLLRARELAGQEGKVADDPNSKPSRIINNLLEIYRSDSKATQAVFSQIGINKSVTKTRKSNGETVRWTEPAFSTVHDMVERLVQAGVPRNEIAIVKAGTTKAKKLEIAKKVRNSEIRIVFGSSQSLGVGVNMQDNLRAMHHMDAPWMPGDLEQRNGRGHRQKNQYNTVLEYRYLTDRIDGRRWQVLAVKDRFIKAFLKSKGDERTIEGDAASDQESDILSSFSEAAGDPRILIREKLNKKIVNLQNKERVHSRAIVDAKRMAANLDLEITKIQKTIESINKTKIIDRLKLAYNNLLSGNFSLEFDGKKYKDKNKAQEAINNYSDKKSKEFRDIYDEKESSRIPDYKKSLEDELDKLQEPIHIGNVGEFKLFAQTYYSNATFYLKTDAINHRYYQRRFEIDFQSIDKLMSGMRNFYKKPDNLALELDDMKKSLDRAIQVSQEPFQQQDKLEQTIRDFDALIADMDLNPEPPPIWLRTGAPIESTIIYDGKEVEVTGHQWAKDGYYVIAKDSEKEYRVPYLQAKDEQGFNIYDEVEFKPPVVEPGQQGGNLTEADRVPDAEDKEYADRSAAQLELELADEIAKQTKSEIVYQRGNIGLMRSFASGTGNVLYVPFFKRNYARVDIDDFTGWQLTEEAKDQLKKAKSKIELKEDKKHAENPFIKYDQQIEKSQSVSNEIQGIVKEWADILGVKANIYLTTFEDARENKDKFTGPHRPIGFAVHQTDENGTTRQLDDGSHYITFDYSSSKTKMLEVIAHELGHIHQKEMFNNAPKELQQEILDEHKKWLNSLKGKTAKQLVDSMRAKTTAKSTEVQDGMMADRASPYWLSFNEWYADQVSRWAMTSEAPQNAVQKFFKRLGQALKAFYLKARNAKYLPNQTFKDYLNKVKESVQSEAIAKIDEEINKSSNTFTEVQDDGTDGASIGERLDKALAESRGNIMKRAINSLRSNKVTEAVKRNALGALTLRQLGEVYEKIQPKVNEYVGLVDRMIKMRNHMAYEASEVVEKWQKWAAKNRSTADALHDLMHEATLYEVDVSKPYTDRARELSIEVEKLKLLYLNYSTNPTIARMLKDEITLIEQKMSEEDERSKKYARLFKEWSKLPVEAQEIYREVRDHYKEKHDRLKSIFEHKLEQAQIDENQKAIMKQVFNVQFKVKEISGPYFPLARFGKYWVEFDGDKADPDDDPRHFVTFETELEQKNFVKALKQQDIVARFGLLTDSSSLGNTTASFVNDVISAVDETVSASSNAGHDLKDMIYQMYLKTIPERSMMRNRIHRKGVKGFSKNAIRAFADNMMKQAYQLARLEYSDDMQQLISDMEKDAKTDGSSVEKGRVHNEMVKRHQWVMNPSNSGVANFATSLGFMYMLSTSPAAAGVNLTQSFTTGVPSMSAEIGVSMTKAATRLVKNSRKFGWLKGRIKSENMTDDENRAMQEWIDMGMIDSTGSHELLGIAENGGYQYSDKQEKIMRFMGGMFHRAEQFNREVTALSAYQLARENGKNHSQAVKLAAKVTWEAHFDYANHNRARFMQSDAAKVAMQFKQYSQSMTYYLLRNFQQGLLSSKWSSADAKAARRKLIGSLGITAAMGGISTMPLWAIYALANFIFDDDEDKPWDAKTEFNAYLTELFGDEAADWIMYGAGGAGFAGRISLDGMWLRDPGRDLESQEMYEHIMPQLVGPVLGGIVPNMFRGVGYLREGEYQKAVEKMSPKFIRDLSKAQRYYTEGQVNRQGAVLKDADDFSALEIIGQALGFSDDDVIKQYTQNNAIADYSTQIQRRRKLLLNKYYAAWYAKDRAALKEALADIHKWNKTHIKHEKLRIKPSTLSKSVKSREARREEAIDGLNVNKSLMYLVDQLQLAG